MAERAAIVVAGGVSSRFGGDKLMTEIAGRPLVVHTVEALIDHVDRCVLVCRRDQHDLLSGLDLTVEVVLGGSTRTESEMAGLAVAGGNARLIGIHDGARPLIPAELTEALYSTAARVGSAVPVLKPETAIISRESLKSVPAAVAQTPQVFRGDILHSVYAEASREGFSGHDTAEVVSRYSNIEIAVVPGDPDNIKVTYPADLERVRAQLEDPSRNGPR